MKFMSNAGVFIVIAAFAAYAAGTVDMPEESRLVVQDSADDEQPGASLRLRLRRCVAHDQCDSNGNCVSMRVCRMRREDFAVLDAAMGVYEHEIRKQIGTHRARRSVNADLVEEDAHAAGALQLRLRRCVFTVGRDSKGNQAEQIVCRMKREDFATLDAAMGVYEDVAPVGDNSESVDDEQPDASSPLRLPRGVHASGCDNRGNCGTITVGRMKRDDVESADDEQPDASSPLRLPRGVHASGCDNKGNCGMINVGRMKRDTCRWQCVCTTGNGGNVITHYVSVDDSRGRRGVSMSGASIDGHSLSTTITSGRCGLFSPATCQSVKTCY